MKIFLLIQKSKLSIILVQLFCILMIPQANAWRIGSTDQKWSQISTLHFDFIFPEANRQLALHYAQFAESQLEILKKTFADVPSTITVIINDSTDSSNGYATVIPFPHIMIYPVQVGEDTTLSEGSNWASELFVHELIHILQMYPSRGVYRFIKPVFGSIIAPNLLLPSWWKEGMAVEAETQFNAGGRLRSSYQSATNRALFIDNKLQNLTLAQINENLLRWPYGNMPYLMGSYVMSELAHDQNFESLGRLTGRQAERAPFFIEAPIIEITGGSYESLFQRTKTRLIAKAQDQIGALETTDITKGTPVSQKLRTTRWPRYSPDGKYLAVIGSNDDETGLHIFEKKSDTWEPIIFKNSPTGEIESFVWSENSKLIYFTKFDRLKRTTHFTDIFVFDLQAAKSHRLSENLRARQLAMSPNGKKLAFVTTGNGRTEAKTIDMSSDVKWADFKPNSFAVKSVHQESFDSRINGIDFVDSETLLLSIRDQKGLQTQIFKSVETGQTQKQMKISADLRYPIIKNNSVFYVSATSGVMNVYQRSLDGGKNAANTPTVLTNVLTGVQSFDVDPSRQMVAATLITANGFQVYESAFPLGKLELKQIERPIAKRYLKTDFHQTADTGSPLVLKSERDYSPWTYLIPKFWIPFVATSSSEDGFYLQALTSGFDPLQTHNYQAMISYDTALKRTGYSLVYANHVLPWPVQLTADSSYQIFGTVDTIIEKRMVSLSTLPELFGVSKNLTVAIGPQYLATGINQNSNVPLTEHVGLAATTIYSSIEQKPWHYHPMHGWSAIGRIEWNKALQDYGSAHPSFGRLTLGATKYWSDFLPKDHALFLKSSVAYIPETVAGRYGTSNAGVSSATDSTKPEFLLRGYRSGQFFGTQLATVNAEYRLPLLDVFRGSGSDPFFVRYMTAAAVLDGLTVKGEGLTENETFRVLPFGPSYWSAGAEIRMSTTVGYLLPLNFVIGAYVPFSPEFSKSASLGLSLQIGGAGLGSDQTHSH